MFVAHIDKVAAKLMEPYPPASLVAQVHPRPAPRIRQTSRWLRLRRAYCPVSATASRQRTLARMSHSPPCRSTSPEGHSADTLATFEKFQEGEQQAAGWRACSTTASLG